MANSYQEDTILDYGRAKYFSYKSPINNLYIDIKGRMRIRKDGAETTYLMLAPHPREVTWLHNTRPYSDMIEMSNGASSIGFIMVDGGRTIITRNFQSAIQRNSLHECIASPYGDEKPYEPKKISTDSLVEISSKDDLYAAAMKQLPVYSIVSYKIDNVDVRIDFQVDLININPSRSDQGTEWQAVSPSIPVFIGGDLSCGGVRQGVVAVRETSGELEFVYLCEGLGEVTNNNFNCTFGTNGFARFFRPVN